MTLALKTVCTIGVYGSTEDAFFGALQRHEIQLFIDIRMRRGLRGSKYKYANAAYLQDRLSELGIGYAHLKQLAPTREIRALQQRDDERDQIRKRDRTELGKAYIRAFKRDILKAYKRKPENKLDPESLLREAMAQAAYPDDQALRRIALFCVEANHKACHRSLVAEAFGRRLGVEIRHIET